MNIGQQTCVLALSLAGALTMNGLVTQSLAQESHFNELATVRGGPPDQGDHPDT